MANCQMVTHRGGPCLLAPLWGSDYCYHHSEMSPERRAEVRRKAKARGKAPARGEARVLPEPDDGTSALPANQRDAIARVRQEHGQDFPDCDGAAVVFEPCGHGGTRWICWGCRDVIAGLGQSDDLCLDHFRIRAVDPQTMNFLCSPLPLPHHQVEHLRRLRA